MLAIRADLHHPDARLHIKVVGVLGRVLQVLGVAFYIDDLQQALYGGRKEEGRADGLYFQLKVRLVNVKSIKGKDWEQKTQREAVPPSRVPRSHQRALQTSNVHLKYLYVCMFKTEDH